MKATDLGTTSAASVTWDGRRSPDTAARGVSIRRHSAAVAAARLPLAGLWIALRFLLIPILYVPLKFGSRMSWAFAVDSFMKRLLYPLTEQPDDALQNAVGSSPPHRLPAIAVSREGVESQLSEIAAGRPLLLVLYRGSWCPYSRLHLADLAAVAEQMRELGITVLAVSAHNHEGWWRAKGVKLSFAADPDGELFRAMGVCIEPPLAHRAWGMLLPHESVFLFDRSGQLVMADLRRLSSTKTRQTFLRSARWLARGRELVAASSSVN